MPVLPYELVMSETAPNNNSVPYIRNIHVWSPVQTPAGTTTLPVKGPKADVQPPLVWESRFMVISILISP